MKKFYRKTFKEREKINSELSGLNGLIDRYYEQVYSYQKNQIIKYAFSSDFCVALGNGEFIVYLDLKEITNPIWNHIPATNKEIKLWKRMKTLEKI